MSCLTTATTIGFVCPNCAEGVVLPHNPEAVDLEDQSRGYGTDLHAIQVTIYTECPECHHGIWVIIKDSS